MKITRKQWLLERSEKLLDIREGELTRVLLMGSGLFIFITALMIVKPVAGAMFLTRFGASQLPFAYMLTAVCAAGISSWYARVQVRTSLDLLMERTLASAMVSLVLFRIFIRFDIVTDWVLYLFYIWTALFALVFASQFWLAAGRLFNIRQAKRLFGIIGSGAITGGILGGYLANFLAPVVGSGNLMLVSAAFLLLCIWIVRRLWRAQQDHNPDTMHPAPRQPAGTSIPASPLSLIRSSSLLTTLAAILGLGVMVSKLVDYQFNAIAAAAITDTDQLTAFLGFWISNLNFISLMVQLVVTRRIVGKLGVGFSLFFLPIFVLAGAGAILISPSLWSAIFIKMSEGGLKNSLNKSGMEILTIPIPVAIKNQTKPFIDVIVDSAATGIGGAILAVLVVVLNGTPAQVSWVIIGIIGVWLTLIRRLKKEYVLSFREKISSDRPDTGTTDMAGDASIHSVLGGIIESLKRSDDREVLKTLTMVSDLRNDALVPALVGLLDHPAEEIRLEALKKLYFSRTPSVETQARGFLDSAGLPLRTESLRYLVHRSKDRSHLIDTCLKSPDYVTRGAALLALVREARSDRWMKNTYRPGDLIERLLFSIAEIKDPAQLVFTKKLCITAISTGDIPRLYPYLHLFMEDRDHSVAAAAIEVAGQTQQGEFVQVILTSLSRAPMLRSSAMKALSGYGPQILEFLSNALANSYLDYSARKHLPNVIAMFPLQRSVDILVHQLEQPDIELRYAIIRALNRLRVSSSSLRFDKQGVVRRIRREARDYMDMLQMLNSQRHTAIARHGQPDDGSGIHRARLNLMRALEARLDTNLERLFRLLGLNYPPNDMYNAYRGIRSTDHEMRINAMEFLDNVLELNLKNIIMPLLESGGSPFEQEAAVPEAELPDEVDTCIALLRGPDDYLREKTLHFLIYDWDRSYTPHVAPLLGSANRGVRAMAKIVLNRKGPFPL